MFLAVAAACTQAADIPVLDTEQRFSRVGLQVKAENVVHRRENYLLFRIQPHGMRTIEKTGGGTETVWLKDRGLAFLRVTIRCDGMTITVGGKRDKPDTFSPCKGSAQFETADSPPVFVAFKYPANGSATLLVPITVSPPPPVVEERLVRGPSGSPGFSGKELLGEHELAVSLFVPDVPAR